MKKIFTLYKRCKKSGSFFIIVLIRYLYLRLRFKKRFLLHQNVRINRVKNIVSGGKLEIGIGYVGFSAPNDKTYLNINGELRIRDNYSIGRGCRFDIGQNAIVSIGNGGYINCNSSFIIMHSLTIGNNCAISWDCQFLDEDFHSIDYHGKNKNDNSIKIGDNVWIGCGVKVYKGTVIPDGCVVASNSIVKGKFTEPNTLIGGHPAKVIKNNIKWS